MQSVEDLVDFAIERMIEGLDGELAAIEALYAGSAHDIGTMDRPRTTGGENGTGDYYPGGTDVIVRYPTIEVAAPDLSGDTFSIDQHESDQTPVVIIRAWLQDAKFQTLYRMVNRYGSAIHNLLCTPDDATARGCGFGPDVTIRRYTARWRFNPQTGERDQVTSAVLLAYWLDAPDVRP